MSVAGTSRRLTGHAKETVGKLTGSKRLRVSGRLDRVRGSLTNGLSHLRHRASGVQSSVASSGRRMARR
ncbi:CsbD family protein [Streptomyces spiramenti]|uniref:CsbD family protein n=1 Tax=Streptomyces spiramenti TaxID=2720606 RepID=A0ABX1APE6_9ACTN|nr:CsbD family protein [Streptomyces spiramenti]NJP68939.1 CsbD family protein [Streptomyces spiramenti]